MPSPKLIYIGAYHYCKPEDIVLLKGNINYTDIYFANGRKLTVATTLKTLEKRLETNQEYCRTHKSFIINLKHLKKLGVINRLYVAEMLNGLVAGISKRKTPLLKLRLSINEMLNINF